MSIDWSDEPGSDRLATVALVTGVAGGLVGLLGFFGYGGALLSWVVALAITLPLAIAGHRRARTSAGRASATIGLVAGVAPLAIFALFVGVCAVSGCD